MGFDFGSAFDALMDVYGEAVSLVGNDWRYDVTAVMQKPWVGANANGIPIARTEPVATFYTTDIEQSGIGIGDKIEHGLVIYRILGRMDDEYGATELMLTEES